MKKVLMLGWVLLGTAHFWTDLFKLKELDRISYGLGFSPLPLVFSNPTGIEDFANRVQVRFQDPAGIETNIDFNKAVFQNLPVYPTLRAVYAISLIYSTHFPELLWKPAVHYGFCHSGDLAKAFGQSIPEKLEIHIRHVERPEQQWTYGITCQK